MTLLVSLSVNIEKLVCCISAKKNYYNFTKNSHKFQTSVTERCTSTQSFVKSFKSTCKNFKSLKKNFIKHELLHKCFFMFPVRFFSPIYRSLFISYTYIIFISYYVYVYHIYIIISYLINLFNYSLYFLDYLKNTFAASQRCAVGAGKVKPFFCLYVFH